LTGLDVPVHRLPRSRRAATRRAAQHEHLEPRPAGSQQVRVNEGDVYGGHESATAAQHCLQPCRERPRPERLREEVVRAQLEHPHFVDRKSTRLNSSHVSISYAVFCLKKKTNKN